MPSAFDVPRMAHSPTLDYLSRCHPELVEPFLKAQVVVATGILRGVAKAQAEALNDSDFELMNTVRGVIADACAAWFEVQS